MPTTCLHFLSQKVSIQNSRIYYRIPHTTDPSRKSLFSLRRPRRLKVQTPPFFPHSALFAPSVHIFPHSPQALFTPSILIFPPTLPYLLPLSLFSPHSVPFMIPILLFSRLFQRGKFYCIFFSPCLQTFLPVSTLFSQTLHFSPSHCTFLPVSRLKISPRFQSCFFSKRFFPLEISGKSLLVLFHHTFSCYKVIMYLALFINTLIALSPRCPFELVSGGKGQKRVYPWRVEDFSRKMGWSPCAIKVPQHQCIENCSPKESHSLGKKK